MSRLLLVLLALGIILAAYFFLPPTQKELPETTSGTPETQISPAETSTDNEDTQALTHIKNITANANVSIDASTASHFVTEDQLIQLPDTANGRGSYNQNNDVNNSAGVQTFGVKMPVFDPKNKTITNSEDNSYPTSYNARLGNQVKLKELLDQSDNNGKRIFYIHAVNPNDRQGIWGILQKGLTDTFAKGITLSDKDKLIKATIPLEADEALANRESSFLGRLLHNKVTTTHIYNFRQGLLGQNPDLITPGQQLIIVTFTEDELLAVYNHYNQQGQTP
mgnify:CR=1 FL=1